MNSAAVLRFIALLSIGFPLILNAGEGEASDAKNKAVDPELAIQQFHAPLEFKIDLFAAEPMLKNPVAFCFDENGRIYMAETERLVTSVYDVRGHLDMYTNDLACRTVEDRAAMVKKFLGDHEKDLAVASDQIRLLEDTKGTGKADRSTIFAGGFNGELEGLGAGVLARKGDVYYTDIPNLWLLRDTNHTGTAQERTSLSYGYGVRYNYAGHDLHGLILGPDGRLYFTIGDRGLHVVTKEGKTLDYPDTGSVLRCNLDGSGLEVFAYGLRNPQDLAFDDHGNLFTGDNNCDYGDASRLVYIVQDGDSGWRVPNQFSDTTPAGVWNSEKLWFLHFPDQAAYLVPPIAHIASGPSGIAHYPGTGFPDSYKDHFFLCDFRGSPTSSGVHGFALKETGAGYKMVDHSQFFWNILATDVKFSPDGRMFVSDWVQGWDAVGLGRLYRLYDPDLVNSKLVQETKQLIADGMEHKGRKELETLLSHPDQRVRQEAQFEIVDRALAEKSKPALNRDYTADLIETALNGTNSLARLHGIWGLGQIGRAGHLDALAPLKPLLQDKDAEVRAQTAKILGEALFTGAADGLIEALGDASLRVRFFAAIALGKLGTREAVTPIITLLRENADNDPFVRHAGVMGLVGTADQAELVAAGKDESRSVRMGALLAMRRLKMPEVSMFLHDSDPLLVLEAARAINDVPINESMPQLASLIDHPTRSEPLDWRVVNANFRLGSEHNAEALANYATQQDATSKVREEALFALETWAAPGPRDRVTGFWRPLPPRDGKPAVAALAPDFSRILEDAPEAVQLAAIVAAQKLSLTATAPLLFNLASNTQVSAKLRVASLETLGDFHDSRLQEAVQMSMADGDQTVREAGMKLLAQINPDDAVKALASVLQQGTVREKQSALTELGTLKGQAPDQLIAEWLGKLIDGKAAKELQLDIVEAATNRDSTLVKDKVKQYENSRRSDDEFIGFRETLYGGNAEAGKKIFMERPDVSCLRCHKIHGKGGEVGPDLAGIITRHDREYILESILFPNKQIAAGFESLIVQMNDGKSYSGVVKSQTDDELTLLTQEETEFVPVKLKKSDIKKKVNGLSAMPEGIGKVLSKADIRNLVEYLATLK
ncbi:MAG TPA: PVC-type heme-binding CxxCH protein [Verrucomicrobiae bacterium]|nr:PVC-type heme-binding CxxCH protein [Verrucomicrobiae bacterium]